MKYAIVENGGKQYRAVEGGTIEVDLLPLDPGKDVKLESVLLLVDGENVTVGTPVIKNASIKARVVEHLKGEKTVNFQYSPKKRIRTKTGHRQSYTRLAIETIAVK
jgi:large subunit ribosomal protein L21